MSESEIRELAQFWGKARPDGQSGSVMHPLLAHMLDVAAVAMELPLGKSCGLDIRLVGFLVALHDIGKLSPAFQKKVPDCLPDFLSFESAVSADHTAATLQILTKFFGDEKSVMGPLFQHIIRDKGLKKFKYLKKLRQILSGVAGHHGKPIPENEYGNLDVETFQRAEKLAALLLNDVFQPPLFPLSIFENLREIEWKLTALTIQADWVGSCQEWFPYTSVEMMYNPKDYFEKIAVPQAKQAVIKAGLAAVPVAEFEGIKNLFPAIEKPSPLQSLVEGTPLPDGPALVIIEDMTGSGKTEAALTVAHRLMEKTANSHGAAGLFVGLPTMATANAMFERLRKAYQKLFLRKLPPSLALAHGRAGLYENFCAAIMPKETDEPLNPDTAEFYCTEWLGNDSRRALMAHVGVGTIDQALLSVLPVRHTAIRQAGLSHKVILIDECHAFDSYMNEEIYALLRFHAALGGSAILLSATLTKAIREKLIGAFQSGLGEALSSPLKNESYPLVTIAGSFFRKELPCDLRPGLARKIKVTRLNTPQETETILLNGFRKNAACCWIRNTVDDVIETARALAAQGDEVTVFHARFAMIDRLEIEKKVIACFGKESKGTERAGLLIASQVIEQSLDLDFDVLCTDLAPMDLILQRAGRLRRHERDFRPVDKAELFVLSPEPVAMPARLWIKSFLPGAAAVYGDPSLLWRTAKALFRRGIISLPKDMRDLIEEAANREVPNAVPENLAYDTQNKEGADIAAGRQGRHNVLRFEAGYDCDKAPWAPEEKTPTRLETSRYVTVRLAYEKDGLILPWAIRKDETLSSVKEKRKAWSLSEISVRRHRLASVIVPSHLTEAVEKARSGWSKWERDDLENHLLLVVVPGKNAWKAQGIDEKDHKIDICYSEVYGLEINEITKS